VTAAAVLLAYAACVGTLGARVLGRAGWMARAPLLGIVTYLAASWSVLAALGLAGVTLAVHATALGGGLSHLIGACVLRLRALYATPGGATIAGLGLILAGAVAARTRCGTRKPRGWSGIPNLPWEPSWWSMRPPPPIASPAGTRW
jgi:bla regulator protein blaR1